MTKRELSSSDISVSLFLWVKAAELQSVAQFPPISPHAILKTNTLSIPKWLWITSISILLPNLAQHIHTPLGRQWHRQRRIAAQPYRTTGLANPQLQLHQLTSTQVLPYSVEWRHPDRLAALHVTSTQG